MKKTKWVKIRQNESKWVNWVKTGQSIPVKMGQNW